MLVHLRSRVVDAKGASPERSAMAAAAFAMSSPRRWGWALRSLRAGRLLRGRRAVPPPLSAWTGSREVPLAPRRPLRDQWPDD
jgi:L-lactate dehydrogenase complex protein LldF